MGRRHRASQVEEWSIRDPASYAYLLGCYLGDGYILHRPPNSWTLRVSCDRQYPGLKGEVAAAMAENFPGASARVVERGQCAADELRISHPAVRLAFPQHGPGRKHDREIVLAEWQAAITRACPGPLVRGLIHSDGCRTVNKFRTQLPSGRVAEYAYPRYFFSNLSADIREICAEHCRLLGVRVTQSNHRNLSVSHRASVAILDEIVGPKY